MTVQHHELEHALTSFFRSLTSAVGRAQQAHENRLAAFFAGVEPAVLAARRAQAELDRAQAPRFSLFSYFNTGELDLSRIFGDLLDPRGTHGQGDVFLRVLLDDVRRGAPTLPEYSDLSDCQVHLELVTAALGDPRRIDIVLELPGGYWIGIENKPWAADQEHQVRDYLADLDLRAGGCGDRVRLLYLSGDGVVPTEYPDLAPDDRARCVTVPFRTTSQHASVENWIGRCVACSRAERVSAFLSELLAFIRRTFGRGMPPAK